MKSSTEELLQEVLKLPNDERAEFAEALAVFLDQHEREAEIERRVDEIETGKVKPIPFKEAMEELRRTTKKSP